MANFEQAIKWMREGKKVQRDQSKNLNPKAYYYLDGKDLRFKGYTDHTASFNISFYEDNWEIYEEVDEWNAFKNLKKVSTKDNVIYRGLQYGDLQTLKAKIIEDLNEMYIHADSDVVTRACIENVKDILDKRFGF